MKPEEAAKKCFYYTEKSEYGPKLVLQFPYQQDLVAAIKKLPWETTHRRYRPWDHEWELDYTPDAVAALEELGFHVPEGGNTPVKERTRND